MSRASPRFQRDNIKLPTPVNNVYKVTLLGTVENQVTASTFFYRDQNSIGTANLTHMTNLSLAVLGATALIAKYAACGTLDWAMTGYRIECVTSPSLSTLQGTITTAGGGPNPHEPTEVAVWLIRRTGVKGQCGRGRTSAPPVPTAWVTNSKLTTLTSHNALANESMVAYAQGGDTFTPALFSRDGSHAFPGLGAADLNQCSVQPLLGTVRRRRIGRGK